MLRTAEAELAEAFSRLCVLRTEDYHLLKSIRKVQRKRPDPAYLSLLIVEFRMREEWRSEREVELLSQLDTWEYNYFTAQRETDIDEWNKLGAFTSVYVECIRAVYHLHPSDLTESPFTKMDACQFLYSCTPTSAFYPIGYHRVLEMFAPLTKEESRRILASAVVDTLYPLQRDLRTASREVLDHSTAGDSASFAASPPIAFKKSGTLPPSSSSMRATLMEVAEAEKDIINSHVKPIVRLTLRSSRKVWQVLFLLWKHLLTRCALEKVEGNVLEECVARALSITTGNFLSTQRCRFVSLLESTDTMHQQHSSFA